MTHPELASEVDLLAALFDPNAEQVEWQERALCAQTDPEAFFPEKGSSTWPGKRICVGCPVKAECLEYALANDERFGIWGGLSERERRRLKKRVRDLTPEPAGPPVVCANHGTATTWQDGRHVCPEGGHWVTDDGTYAPTPPSRAYLRGA